MKLQREELGDDYYAHADEGHEAEEAADNRLSCILSRDQCTCSRAFIHENFTPRNKYFPEVCVDVSLGTGRDNNLIFELSR